MTENQYHRYWEINTRHSKLTLQGAKIEMAKHYHDDVLFLLDIATEYMELLNKQEAVRDVPKEKLEAFVGELNNLLRKHELNEPCIVVG